MDLRLNGKRVAVSGATKGIGRAVAYAFADEGCALLLAARDGDALRDTAVDLKESRGVAVETYRGDLSTSEHQLGFARACAGTDILINCAGSNPAGGIEDISDKVWRDSWDLKVFSYINITRAVFTDMKTRGGGVIVNVIGNSADRMNDKYILGSTGNLALAGLTKALGARSPDFGVRILGVHPGATATDRIQGLLRDWSIGKYGTPNHADDVLASMNLPFGRLCDPSEIADAVVFLASPRASYVSGTILTVDGGATNRNN